MKIKIDSKIQGWQLINFSSIGNELGINYKTERPVSINIYVSFFGKKFPKLFKIQFFFSETKVIFFKKIKKVVISMHSGFFKFLLPLASFLKDCQISLEDKYLKAKFKLT